MRRRGRSSLGLSTPVHENRAIHHFSQSIRSADLAARDRSCKAALASFAYAAEDFGAGMAHQNAVKGVGPSVEVEAMYEKAGNHLNDAEKRLRENCLRGTSGGR